MQESCAGKRVVHVRMKAGTYIYVEDYTVATEILITVSTQEYSPPPTRPQLSHCAFTALGYRPDEVLSNRQMNIF